MKITFVGGGNMASALIGGLIKEGTSPSQLRVIEINEANRKRLRNTYGVIVFETPEQEAIAESDVVVLAVKPQQMKGVAVQLAPLLVAGQIVLSIAAGIRLTDLAKWLGGAQALVLVRAMPNTPALVGAGVTGLCGYSFPPMHLLNNQQRESIEKIVGAVGSFAWVDDETKMDAITAVSGSGPAYVFYFIEALEAAGIALGLPAAQARELALATFQGAAQLASQSEDAPAVLRAKVTSKGGTTERAIQSMEDAAVKEKVVAAVKAAATRSRELGDQLGAG